MAHGEGDLGDGRPIGHVHSPGALAEASPASSLTPIVARLNPPRQAPIPMVGRG
jgi:hypothetical protein